MLDEFPPAGQERTGGTSRWEVGISTKPSVARYQLVHLPREHPLPRPWPYIRGFWVTYPQGRPHKLGQVAPNMIRQKSHNNQLSRQSSITWGLGF